MIGIDEVGRGCLAGPLLVVAARQISPLPDGLADSKVLSRADREGLFTELINSCLFGEGWVTPAEIDLRGLASAMRLGVARALKALRAEASESIIMDGPVNYVPKKYINLQCLIDADALVPVVSAASVYAKVRRDSFMTELKYKYPLYGFEAHVGYGTRKHLMSIETYGAIKNLHRMSFSPLRRFQEASL